MESRRIWQHWPAMVLALVVVVIFLLQLMAFQVHETEHAMVLRFGSPRTDAAGNVIAYESGLHFKWPYPIEEVWRHDKRKFCYQLTRGQVEECQTADHYQVIISTYVEWQVGDLNLYRIRCKTREEAEYILDDLIRNSRSIVLGRHNLTSLINVDSEQVRIEQIEQEMLDHITEVAESKYGVQVTHLGIKHLGFPETVSEKVFDRMRAERRRVSERYRSEGKAAAAKIEAEANLTVSDMLSQAEADAMRTRAEGDRRAAEYYAVFRENPELAVFLRKLSSLRRTLGEKTTLIVDTNTPPYDLLLPGATNLRQLLPEPNSPIIAEGERK